MSSAESRHSAPEADKEMQRRSTALTLFINSPQDAAAQYPDLIEGLREFVRHSCNPYEHELTGQSKDTGEDAFNRWVAAKAWSLKYDTG